MPRRSHHLAVILVACALALRAWVPAGWMPAPGARDFAIMPCPAAAPAAMDMGHGSGHQDHSSSTGDCFSPLLAGVALPDPPVAIAPPLPPAAPEQTERAAQSFTPGPSAPPPHSTGPPAIA